MGPGPGPAGLAKAIRAGSPKWWKKHKKKAEFRSRQGVQGRRRRRLLRRPGPANRSARRPTSAAGPHPDADDEPDKGLIPGLDPRVVYGKMKNAVGLGPNDQVAHEAFMEGRAAVRSETISRGGEGIRRRRPTGPSTCGSRKTRMFMLAESYYFDDRYIKARDAYNALADKYPSTRYLDTLVAREWKIAQYLGAVRELQSDWPMTPNAWDKTRPWFDTIGHAIKTYENIRMNDPTGPRADDAIMATANIYFRRGALRRRRLPLHAVAARVSAERVSIRGPSAGPAVEAAQVPGRRLRRHAARRGPAARQAAPHELRRPAQRRRTRTAARR